MKPSVLALLTVFHLCLHLKLLHTGLQLCSYVAAAGKRLQGKLWDYKMNSGFLFFFVQDKTCSSKIVLMEMEPLQTQTVHTVTVCPHILCFQFIRCFCGASFGLIKQSKAGLWTQLNGLNSYGFMYVLIVFYSSYHNWRLFQKKSRCHKDAGTW